MKIAFISPIDSVNKDRIAFAAGANSGDPAGSIIIEHAGRCRRNLGETRRSEETRARNDDEHDDEDHDDGGGDGEAAGRGRSAPGKIFAPGGKLVSERLRSMTEDERVRTAQQERSAERERKRDRGRMENWIERDGETETERKRCRVRNEEGGCFASVT